MTSIVKKCNLQILFLQIGRSKMHGEKIQCEWDGSESFSVKLESGESPCLSAMMRILSDLGYKIIFRNYAVSFKADGAIRTTQTAKKDLFRPVIVIEKDGSAKVTKASVSIV